MMDTKKRVARLKLRHLSVIYWVGHEGSLQRASHLLALSQSAVSKTLAEAEAIMQTQLFERSALGSRATALGDVLVRYAAKVMSELDRAGDEFAALAEGETGTLTVGVFTPVGWWGALVRGVSDFHAMAPRVRLTLKQGPMEQFVAVLERGDVDVVVGRIGDVSRLGNMHIEPLYDDGGPRFVARAAHPLANVDGPVELADMVKYPWFLPEEPSVLVDGLQVMVRQAGLPWPNRVIYSHVYTVNLAMCASSDMIALLPGFTVTEVGSVYGLRKLFFEPGFSFGPISALWRRGNEITPAIQKFVERLKANC
jgi:DNA-binding transcriptional LysR family regulator